MQGILLRLCYVSAHTVELSTCYRKFELMKVRVQARRRQLKSGAAKSKKILKTPQQKGFIFFISENLILTGKKELQRKPAFRNASAGPGVIEISSYLASCVTFVKEMHVVLINV